MALQPESVFPSSSPRSFRKLPERPDLDQLRKQAKELLRRCASGDAEAAAEVRAYFTPERDAPLTLAQAQLVLARAHGFDSWPKLKAFVEGVHKQALVDAIHARDLDAVRAILRRRPELADATTGRGEQSMIHLAVLNDDAAVLRLLMEHGADARRGIYPHRESTSALRMASERGLDHLVRVIADVERERQEAMSCPNVTVSPEQERLAALIREGRSGEAIAQLEASPALMKQCDREGATPLHVACSCADEPAVAWLCDHRADARKLDASNHTPIDRAALSVNWRQQGRVAPATAIMHRLLRRGCEFTPLAAAALGDVQRLRQLHAEAPARLTEGYHWLGGGLLTRAVHFGQIDAVRCLLDLGLPPDEAIPLGRNSDDEEAWSWGGPLWHAAAFGHLDIARLLLDRGADPNANVYASGWPLDRAYERGDRAMVDLLYERGARPSIYTVCAAHDLGAARRVLAERGDDPQLVREMVWAAACSLNLPALELALPRLIQLQDRLTPERLDWHTLLWQPMRGREPNEHVRPATYRHEDRFTILQQMLDASG